MVHPFSGETVSNHDELMSNFIAQPDALAYGKVNSSTVFFGTRFVNCFDFLLELTASFQTPEQLRSENVSENLIPHKVILVHLFLIWSF